MSERVCQKGVRGGGGGWWTVENQKRSNVDTVHKCTCSNVATVYKCSCCQADGCEECGRFENFDYRCEKITHEKVFTCDSCVSLVDPCSPEYIFFISAVWD